MEEIRGLLVFDIHLIDERLLQDLESTEFASTPWPRANLLTYITYISYLFEAYVSE
jgi:hypothetical protein